MRKYHRELCMTTRCLFSPKRKKMRLVLVLLAVLVGEVLVPSSLSAEQYTLRIGSGHPAGPTVYVTVLRDYLVPELKRRVEAETEHELRIIEGYGGSIATVSETLEAVQAGILDIGAFCTCFEPAKMFLHNFQYFVPFGPQDAELGIRMARRVYEAHPWLSTHVQEKFSQTIIAISGFDNYHLGTSMPWKTVDELQGVKIAGAGPNLPWLRFAGVVPVQSTLPDGYMSLQTGVYSGWVMFPSAYYAYKYHEPAPYYTLIGFGAMGGAVVVTMNNRSMNRLPASVQKIVREVARQYETESGLELDHRQALGLESLRQSGADVRTLAPDTRSAWAHSLRDFPRQMAEEADARALPGSAVLRTYIEAVNQSGYEWPVEYRID